MWLERRRNAGRGAADVVERTDVWMVQAGDSSGLALEAIGKAARANLDGDGFFEHTLKLIGNQWGPITSNLFGYQVSCPFAGS